MNRLRELDGLRGLAALIVLIYHISLTYPSLAAPYYAQPVEGPLAFALTYTPLHLLRDGRMAVYIFFVLSGLVLALPVLARGRAYPWLAYYPQRLIRLYLPVWAAVALGVALIALVPRGAEMGSIWLESAPDTFGATQIALDLTLVAGVGGVVSPLWTLRWEVLFSLLLPVYMFLATKFRRQWWALALASLILIGVGFRLDNEYLSILPMFMLGVASAAGLDDIRRSGEALKPRWRGLLLICAALLLVSPWLAQLVSVPGGLVGHLRVAVAAGAMLTVWCAICVPSFGNLLKARPFQWLGAISFSLYLIHEPIVIASAFWFGAENLILAGVVSCFSSLLLASVFLRFVERPSHRLALLVGRLLKGTLPQPSASATR
ncbi:acyltransferase [Pseudoclavibacter sp. AY1F1]|uniref:acyltransferase family protein n=1 Tax=Pseudoclavibacter sp. AY1F1 TaxID=2080583 RepID=UPI000CE74964|nr:acyltransferase [Pseudoclavibacter sp. AY1F1]PPF43579.1 acyltransferase [Pseudoclavibacter sp. AY1F1]